MPDSESDLDRQHIERIRHLADRIRTELSSRELPITISQGVTITDLDTYARIEAGQALCNAPAISRPARARLKLLGIEPKKPGP
jgi:hypothetical protein